MLGLGYARTRDWGNVRTGDWGYARQGLDNGVMRGLRNGVMQGLRTGAMRGLGNETWLCEDWRLESSSLSQRCALCVVIRDNYAVSSFNWVYLSCYGH
jgi:hypothetical protein